jgi:hypothetical protein
VPSLVTLTVERMTMKDDEKLDQTQMSMECTHVQQNDEKKVAATITTTNDDNNSSHK